MLYLLFVFFLIWSKKFEHFLIYYHKEILIQVSFGLVF